MPLTKSGRQYQRLVSGNVAEPPRESEHDAEINRMRLDGMSLGAIGQQIGKSKSYVQNRLLRIACREEWNMENSEMATGDFDWNDAAIARLREEWAWRDQETGKPLSTAEIGRRMGLTKSAIVGKAHRIGLEGRPSPIQLSGTDVTAKRLAAQAERSLARKATLPPLATVRSCKQCRGTLGTDQALFCSATCESLHDAQQVEKQPKRVATVVPKPPEPKAVPYSHTRQCCWVEGERPHWRYCDAETVPGTSWCSGHLKRIYIKRERREAA